MRDEPQVFRDRRAVEAHRIEAQHRRHRVDHGLGIEGGFDHAATGMSPEGRRCARLAMIMLGLHSRCMHAESVPGRGRGGRGCGDAEPTRIPNQESGSPDPRFRRRSAHQAMRLPISRSKPRSVGR